ncbi:MAG: RidA family protein [Pyrinomonadaceae bacterium]|nr:RidA family protein [Sphingobacteriaceae bacterium]
MKPRINISSGASWEDIVGYSRAVRVGDNIEVSGTTAMNGDTIIGAGDLYAQTIFIFQKIEKALLEAGCSLKDVVRTRMFITNIDNWKEAGRAHAEFFGAIKPASTMIEVQRLIHPELLIEIEATAIITP